MKRITVLLSLIVMFIQLMFSLQAAEFNFVAVGDTAYNGEKDYPAYQELIQKINNSNPALTIHVGDIWGGGNCHDWHIERIQGFFDQYNHPLIYTPGDNEWTDCGHPAMGGYDPGERLQKLRSQFFAKPRSLGKTKIPVIRQSDVSKHKLFSENLRWMKDDVLFLTLNVTGSNNNYNYEDLTALKEAHKRNNANIAWLRDGFRIARDNSLPAVIIALHAEIFMDRHASTKEYFGPDSGPHGAIIREIRLGGERFGKPVLMINGDTHQFVIDRPFLESQGHSVMPKYANITRLEVYGAPEIRAVQVRVNTNTPWVFSFSPLY